MANRYSPFLHYLLVPSLQIINTDKYIYTAITQNNREINSVYNYGLYISTVSIKHKAVDRIKAALRFQSNATRISVRLKSKRTMFVTSISAIVMERYINEQTDEKKVILQRIALTARRYRRFRLRNDSRTCCQNKQNGGQRRSSRWSE